MKNFHEKTSFHICLHKPDNFHDVRDREFAKLEYRGI